MSSEMGVRKDHMRAAAQAMDGITDGLTRTEAVAVIASVLASHCGSYEELSGCLGSLAISAALNFSLAHGAPPHIDIKTGGGN